VTFLQKYARRKCYKFMLQFGTIHTCEFFYLHHQKVASVFGVNPLGYISQLSVYLMNMSRLMKGILALLSAEMIS